MSVQNPDQYSQNQHQQNDANDTHESTSKTDRPISVGENEENHTSGDHIQYTKKGKDSQHETGGQDGKNIHSDNLGGTAADE